MFTRVFVGIVLLTGAVASHADRGKEATTQRIARLIRQLGDDEFKKREAASQELKAIGAPALAALRQAAASDADPEIRTRARQIVEAFDARARQLEPAKWAGSWKNSDGVWLKITGERWASGTPTFGPVAGIVSVTEIKEMVVLAEFAVDQGPTKGQTCKVIFRLDGDSLHYCGTYAGHYPTEFKTVGDYYSCVLKRVKE